jgi:arylsulfatase A-like enzyme
VRAFNQRRGPDRYYGKNWKGEERVFVEMTTASGKPDPAFYSRVRITPYGNEIVLDFARELVKQEGLGEDGVTDFLFIGFSSNDAVGHQWGPYSDEVADMTLRTDEQVARLLKFLDRRVGEGQYWLALSADHGVSPTLAQARARGLEATNIDSGALGEAMRKALRERWGEDEGEWLIPEAGLVFNRDWLKKRGVSLEEAVQVVGEAAMTVEGIAGYVGARVSSVDAATTAAVRRSFYPGRGNDMALIHDRYALFNAERGGATHGTHYPYDTHVPLIFFGGAFRPGTYPERVSTTDLATTLAAALGLTPPALATGKVLARALGSAKASSAARE